MVSLRVSMTLSVLHTINLPLCTSGDDDGDGELKDTYFRFVSISNIRTNPGYPRIFRFFVMKMCFKRCLEVFPHFFRIISIINL